MDIRGIFMCGLAVVSIAAGARDSKLQGMVQDLFTGWLTNSVTRLTARWQRSAIRNRWIGWQRISLLWLRYGMYRRLD